MSDASPTTTRLLVDSLESYPPIDTIDPQDHDLYRREHALHERLLKYMVDDEGQPCDIAHDFWGNLASVRSAKEFPSSREPTIHCMEILGLAGKVDVDDFVTTSQTIPHLNSRQFLNNLGKAFGVNEVNEEMHSLFQHLERSEHGRLSAFSDVRTKLVRLGKRHRQALVTNTPWTSTLHKFLKDEQLDSLLQHKIVSSEVGVAKQDGELIYVLVTYKFRRKTSSIIVIGNDLQLDILPPLKIGMRVILCDREFKYVDKDGNWRRFESAGSFAKHNVTYVDESGRSVIAKLGDLPLEKIQQLTYGDLVVEILDKYENLIEARLADLELLVIHSYESLPAPAADA